MKKPLLAFSATAIWGCALAVVYRPWEQFPAWLVVAIILSVALFAAGVWIKKAEGEK